MSLLDVVVEVQVSSVADVDLGGDESSGPLLGEVAVRLHHGHPALRIADDQQVSGGEPATEEIDQLQRYLHPAVRLHVEYHGLLSQQVGQGGDSPISQVALCPEELSRLRIELSEAAQRSDKAALYLCPL